MSQVDHMEPMSTEDRILKAAEDEFLQNGYAAARTTSIANAAGVTHAMLHYYYRTKEKLFSRVLSDKLSALAQIFQFEIDDDKPLEVCIRAAIKRHFEFVRANPSLPRFMVCEVFANPTLLKILGDKLDQIANNTSQMIQSKIDLAAERGECRRVDARSIMLEILSLNVFPVLAMPMLQRIVRQSAEADVDKFLNDHCEETVQTILSKLK